MIKICNWMYGHRRFFAFFGAVLCLISCLTASAFATDAPKDDVDDVLGVVDKMADKALGANGIGSKVLTFVTSNPLCLIGVASFIMIMLVSLIRRFITGV